MLRLVAIDSILMPENMLRATGSFERRGRSFPAMQTIAVRDQISRLSGDIEPGTEDPPEVN